MTSTAGTPLDQLFVSLNNTNINTLINTISQRVAGLIETARRLRATIEQLATRPNVNNDMIKSVLARVKAFKDRIRGSLSKLNSTEANELGKVMGELEAALDQLQNKGSSRNNTRKANARNASTRTGGPNVPPREEVVSQALTLLREPSALNQEISQQLQLSPQLTSTVSSVLSRVSQLSATNPFGVRRLIELASLIRLGQVRGDILRSILRNIPAVLAMRATNLPNTPNAAASVAAFERVARLTNSGQQLSLSGSTLNATDREQLITSLGNELPVLRDELRGFSDIELISLMILLGLLNNASDLARLSVGSPELESGANARLALGSGANARPALENRANAMPALENRANSGLVRFRNVNDNSNSVSSFNEELNDQEPSSPVPSAPAPANPTLAITNQNEIGSTASANRQRIESRQAVESNISNISPGTTLSTSDPAKITKALQSLNTYLGTVSGEIAEGLKEYVAEKYSRNARSLVGEMGRKHKSVLLYLVKLADLNLEEFSREIQKPIPNVSSQSMNARSDTNERSKILESVMAKYESVPEVLVDANDELIRQVNKARAQQGGTRRGKKRRNVKRHTTRR